MTTRLWDPLTVPHCDRCDDRRVTYMAGERLDLCPCVEQHRETILDWRRAGMDGVTTIASALRGIRDTQTSASIHAAIDLYRSGANVIILAGSPATGKTMAAALIANAESRRVTRRSLDRDGSVPFHVRLPGRALLWVNGAELIGKRCHEAQDIMDYGLVVVDDSIVADETATAWHRRDQAGILQRRSESPLIVTINVPVVEGRAVDLDQLGLPDQLVSRWRRNVVEFAGPELVR